VFVTVSGVKAVYADAAQVADFGSIREMEEEAAAPVEEEVEVDPAQNQEYWDQLLKAQFGELQEQEMALMGKGRRVRREVGSPVAVFPAYNSVGLMIIF
jgi:hypothetical protein